MKFGVPWKVKGMRPEARETAKEAARRAGVSLDDWLNSAVLQQAAQSGVGIAPHSEPEIAGVQQHLNDLTQRIDHFTGAAAYAPRHLREPVAPPALPPQLDRALAEIAARQRELYSAPAPGRPLPKTAQPQNLAALEEQLRKITSQIETLRTPGVEEAIHTLRAELTEIGRALHDAMPRRELEAIERQIQKLAARIEEGRQAGVDAAALSGVEHGLADVRDALHGLMPAENLAGYTEAIHGLAEKIDLIVAEKDPATLHQLENAIVTLRSMAEHVASNETVGRLAAEVQALADKIGGVAQPEPAHDMLASLELRIDALAAAVAERTSGPSPRLEALVASLGDKIDRIQDSRGEHVAVNHLEDRIVALVERLDASDSRLGNLEAIERGLADLLIHIEEMRASRQGAPGSPVAVDALREDVARTQDALETMQGTLGQVVDRLATIERGIRAEQPAATDADDEPLELTQPVGTGVAPPVQTETIPPPPPPRRMPAAAPMKIEAESIDNEPLEPGSGPPPMRANPAARIAASEAALGGALPQPRAAGHASFIAAARRAAQAAASEPDTRRTAAPAMPFRPTASVRGSVMRRVKSLFIAASIVAIVVGSIQIAATMLGLGNMAKIVGKTSQLTAETKPTAEPAQAAPADKPDLSLPVVSPPSTLAAKTLDPPQDSGLGVLSPPAVGTNFITLPPSALPAPKTGAVPGVMPPADPREALTGAPPANPPADITGSIPDAKPPAHPGKTPPAAAADPAGLPPALGGLTLRQLAAAGDPGAAYEVGVRFAEGHGVPVNAEEAARWFERAAAQGIAPAQFRYASQLEKGIGVKRDLIAARKLYLAAAAQGNAKAMHNLAVLYAEGIDGKPDYALAVQWFQKAAHYGVADSQYNLGILYARGIGVTASLSEAYKWFALAAAGGDQDAGKKRDDVAARLDAAALAAAKRAAESFKAMAPPDAAIKVSEPPGGWDKADAPAKPGAPRKTAAFTIGK